MINSATYAFPQRPTEQDFIDRMNRVNGSVGSFNRNITAGTRTIMCGIAASIASIALFVFTSYSAIAVGLAITSIIASAFLLSVFFSSAQNNMEDIKCFTQAMKTTALVLCPGFQNHISVNHSRDATEVRFEITNLDQELGNFAPNRFTFQLREPRPLVGEGQ